MDAQILSEVEAAGLLQVPLPRLRKMARAKQVPCIVLPDGEFRFDEADLRAWLNGLKQSAEATHAR